MRLIFILIGPPGSGKGTQADMLCEKFGFVSYSTGAIFRNEMARGTALGQRITPLMDKGLFVPDDIVMEAVIGRIQKTRRNVILDGFPRTLVQAKLLERFFQLAPGRFLPVAIELGLPMREVYRRVSGRLSCDKCGKVYHVKFRPPRLTQRCDKCRRPLKFRSDATRAVVKTRIKVYQKETLPIVKFFRQRPIFKFFSVKGAQSIAAVSADITKIVKKIK